MLFADDSLTLRDWQELKKLKQVLLPAYTLIKQMQSHDLTPGKFLSQWLGCLRRLRRYGTALSASLGQAMMGRQNALFENQTLLAGIYCIVILFVMTLMGARAKFECRSNFL